ncbi:MAG: tetratricopeptide repeat protein [Pseudomonadota bacterium]
MTEILQDPQPLRANRTLIREPARLLHHKTPPSWGHDHCHNDPYPGDTCPSEPGHNDPHHCPARSSHRRQSVMCLPTNETDPEYTFGIKKRRSRLDGRLVAIFNFIVQIISLFVFLWASVFAFTYYSKYIRKISYDDGYGSGYGDGQQQTNARFFPYTVTPEGGPCTVWAEGLCEEAENAKAAIRFSRYYLNMGDALSAVSDWDQALRYYRQSIFLGSSNGAQAAILAAKRIQFQLMTCEYDEASLARISFGYQNNPLGALIEMRQKQTALKALGYYVEPINNQYTPATRSAIRNFQGDLWFDQTGVLTAEQTTLLICGGAQIAKDSASENILGIMYAGGLGVRQSTDFAMNWFTSSARNNSGDAAWNLALMYGTGTVRASVLVCDAVQNAERADSYLSEAASLGHPAARHAINKYPSDDPQTRWRKLRGDLSAPGILDRVGRGCNPNQ